MRTTAFHVNELNLRGVAASTYDYAIYNEELLGYKSFIISKKKANNTALKKFQGRFEVFLYNDFFECREYVQTNGIDGIYIQKMGLSKDGLILPGIPNYIHAVFQTNDPHGIAYQYISAWLARRMGRPCDYVPYMVQLPEAKRSLRSHWGFDEDTIILGRHGGWTQFNLPFVHEAIYDILEKRRDLAFVFMNTKPFGPRHKRILFLKPTYDLQAKSDFIHACDYMIHARRRGESFGLAVCEFLFHDKPVLSWKRGIDQAHIDIIGEKGLWYLNRQGITTLLESIQKVERPKGYYRSTVLRYAPSVVMQRFAEQFYGHATNPVPSDVRPDC